MILAANYLKIENLRDLACTKLTSSLQPKSKDLFHKMVKFSYDNESATEGMDQADQMSKIGQVFKGYSARKYRMLVNKNEKVRETESKLSPFNWDENDECKDLSRPVNIPNGVYIG